MGLLIPPAWAVPDEFRRRLGDAAGRQRAMAAGGHLLLILHQPPAPGTPERKGRLFWRGPDGEWKASALGAGPPALKKHVAEFAERVEQLEKQWQAARTPDDYFTLLQAVAPVHRTTRNLHATLQHARELEPGDRDLINLRDRAGELERALELLHGDAKNGLDYLVARQAEHQARRMYEMAVAAHRLNLLAAVFFPVATLGAVFGMNLGHGLDTGTEFFWGVLAVGLVCGLILAAFVVRTPAPPTPPAAKYTRRVERL